MKKEESLTKNEIFFFFFCQTWPCNKKGIRPKLVLCEEEFSFWVFGEES